MRVTQSEFTVSVAAVIENESGKVLLLNHVLRLDSGWGIPGGFMNRNEQPEEAVRRELREETGLELKNIKLFRARTFKRHVEILFHAQSDGIAEVKSPEINSLDWFEIDKMPEKMNQNQKQIIKNLLKKNL